MSKKQETMRSANIKGCLYTFFDIQYLQIKGRDTMLLIKVNMIKSLFRFFKTYEKVSKHYHADRKH